MDKRSYYSWNKHLSSGKWFIPWIALSNLWTLTGLARRFLWACVTSGADPGFFSRGGALVSCSTSTPINHIVFFLQNTSCIRKPQVISEGGGGGVRTPCTLPLDPPLDLHLNLRPFLKLECTKACVVSINNVLCVLSFFFLQSSGYSY